MNEDSAHIVEFVKNLSFIDTEILICKLFYKVAVATDIVSYGKRRIKETRYRCEIPLLYKRTRRHTGKGTHKLQLGNNWRKMPRFATDVRCAEGLLDDYLKRTGIKECRIIYKSRSFATVQIGDISCEGRLSDAISKIVLLDIILRDPEVLQILKDVEVDDA